MASPERTAARVAVLGIVASAILAAAKIGAGIAAHSVATISDGFESAADVLSSGLVYLGLWIAAKPPDADHPYGHGRFETLSGLGVGVMLAVMGSAICFHAVTHQPEGRPALFALWALGVSVVTKAVLAGVKMRAGRRAGSSALVADAYNDSVDMISGTVAILAVLLNVDRVGGFLVGIIVIFVSFRVLKETSLQLVDTMPEEAQMAELRAEALKVPGALGIDKCFARKTGLRYHVDLHLEVDPNLTVMASHEIARAVKHHLRDRLDWVADVLVHVEPHFTESARLAKGRQ